MTRTITTVEELDALPTGTVIRAKHGTIIERDEAGTAYIVGNNWPVFWLKSGLPATVLYEPGKQPRPLPDREQIAWAMEQVLIESVGECTCDEAYTTRSLNDPDCIWHNVNPRGEFPGDAADAVLELFR